MRLAEKLIEAVVEGRVQPVVQEAPANPPEKLIQLATKLGGSYIGVENHKFSGVTVPAWVFQFKASPKAFMFTDRVPGGYTRVEATSAADTHKAFVGVK